MIAVAPVAELERLDHPWVQAYFTGPRGRAAQDAQQRHDAVKATISQDERSTFDPEGA